MFEEVRRASVFAGKRERSEELYSWSKMETRRVMVMDGTRSCCHGSCGGACSVDVRRRK